MTDYVNRLGKTLLLNVEYCERKVVFTTDVLDAIYKELDVDTIKDMVSVVSAKNGIWNLAQNGNIMLSLVTRWIDSSKYITGMLPWLLSIGMPR
jgi:hypothetical protein